MIARTQRLPLQILIACLLATACKSSGEACHKQIADCLRRCDASGADPRPPPGAPTEQSLSACESACQRCAPEPPRATPKPTPTGVAPARSEPPGPASSPEAALSAAPAPELERSLTERGLRGVVALLAGGAQTAHCSDVALCRKRFPPASTFKIPNSIIGLETGVIADAEFVIPWDGIERRFPAWNRDHTLRTAIRDSVVPYYQELARRVGRERMQVWLERLHYGNEEIGDALDGFWLEGPLLVSPLEQLAFLRKLADGRLPISARTRAIVLDILVRGDVLGRPLRGKTGWASPETPDEVAWFIGWIEDGERKRFVSVTVLDPPDGVDIGPLRQIIAEEALRAGLRAPAAAPSQP